MWSAKQRKNRQKASTDSLTSQVRRYVVTATKRTKSKCLHSVNLCTYFHDIWQISVG